MTPFYSPVVKGKTYDLKAFGKAVEAGSIGMKPMVDVLPVSVGKTVDQHIKKLVTDLSFVPLIVPIYVDFYGFLPGQIGPLKFPAVIEGYKALFNEKRYVTPVYGFGRDESVWKHLPAAIAAHGKGFCFRIEIEDLDDESENTWANIISKTADLGLTPANVDIFVDLRDIRIADVDELQDLVTDFFSLMPSGGKYRSLCVAGSSAAKDVTNIARDSVGSVYRNELKLWARLRVDVPICSELVYGDYGIIHPDFAENVPCGGTVNCKIRYTIGDRIIVFRGHVRSGDSGQTHLLAQQVIAHVAYRGNGYSAGDSYIYECAHHLIGPGNPANWVFADLNHHYVYVCNQLRKLIGEIDVDISPDEIDVLIQQY
jgi:hypothetical protein